MGSHAAKVDLSEVLRRVKLQLAKTAAADDAGGTLNRESMLLATAARYSSPPTDFSATPPTGFDPDAALLFEALVESALLVACADGEFDADERDVFTLIVLETTERRVSPRQIEAIILDLSTQFAEDGLEQRLERLRRAVPRPSDRREALRIAALLACASAGVSQPEAEMLNRLAVVWDLSPAAVDEALLSAGYVLDG